MALETTPRSARAGDVAPSARARPVALQAALEVGRTDDPAEHEAERVAADITRSPAPSGGRCSCGGIAGPDGECAACKAKRLQRAASAPAPYAVPASVHAALAAPGRALDPSTRAAFEPRLGIDLSGVRVHDDPQAAGSAADVGARAYTVGDDVVFGASHYAPGTQRGDELIAHELVHVAQQRESAVEQPLRRDLARPPAGPGAAVEELTDVQVQEAIAFNQARFSDPYSIRVIRDVVGLAPAPATVNEELVRAIAAWQAERNEAQDGKIGNITTRSLVLELIAEGQRRDAVCLIVDSYGLLHSLALQDIQVGFGQDCCGTAADPADAVTFGGVCGGGGRVRVCVCQNRFPPAIDYNHWVRIVGHEMVHVPQCARAVAGNADADEFEAFFWEACGEGRAPRLTAAQRVGHANHALGLFAALPAADRTAARVGMRDRLNNLVTNNGAGVC